MKSTSCKACRVTSSGHDGVQACRRAANVSQPLSPSALCTMRPWHRVSDADGFPVRGRRSVPLISNTRPLFEHAYAHTRTRHAPPACSAPITYTLAHAHTHAHSSLVWLIKLDYKIKTHFRRKPERRAPVMHRYPRVCGFAY